MDRAEFDRALVAALPALRRDARRKRSVRPEDRADLVHDTILKALEGWDTFDASQGGPMAFTAWLSLIMWRLRADERRRDWRPAELTDALTARLVAAEDQHRALVVRETLDFVETLPAKKARALYGAALGMKPGEQAKAEGCPVQTIKVRIIEGRRALLAMEAA